METYKNIPSTGFTIVETQTSAQKVYVSMNIGGKITLSIFSIYQLLTGAELFGRLAMATSKSKGYDYLCTLSILTKALLGLVATNMADEIVIEVLRGDVENLIVFLNIRMTHCEEERDQKSDKFSADTYIGQKLLLLELKGWLAMYAISEEESEQMEAKQATVYTG